MNCFNTQPPEGGWPILKRPKSSDCSFNTQPPEGGWEEIGKLTVRRQRFQHTAARRRLDAKIKIPFIPFLFQHTAARRRLAKRISKRVSFNTVSTHSRPKAAGGTGCTAAKPGWFQHTAARRRLGLFQSVHTIQLRFQHTAARRRLDISNLCIFGKRMFQHTAARRRLEHTHLERKAVGMFQHTAARRRLGTCYSDQGTALKVSTHSRPKAAGGFNRYICFHGLVSTHSRPKAAGNGFRTARRN